MFWYRIHKDMHLRVFPYWPCCDDMYRCAWGSSPITSLWCSYSRYRGQDHDLFHDCGWLCLLGRSGQKRYLSRGLLLLMSPVTWNMGWVVCVCQCAEMQTRDVACDTRHYSSGSYLGKFCPRDHTRSTSFRATVSCILSVFLVQIL